MIVDASAILAILKSEPEELIFVRALARAEFKRISPVNWHECAVGTERFGNFHGFERLLLSSNISIAPIDEAQTRLAHQAWLGFGKGRHPARLNLGDCFAYALAKITGEPLLYKGGDFARTDVLTAV